LDYPQTHLKETAKNCFIFVKCYGKAIAQEC